MSSQHGQTTRGLRADARRNMEKIRAAAVEVFHAQGLGAPMEDIARRAGVSTGTIYHRFGGRDALIDDVVPELAAQQLGRVASIALAHDDPWEGFTAYLSGICELQAGDAALCDVVSRRYADTELLSRTCDTARADEQKIIDRAIQDKSLRADFTTEDLQFVFWSTASLIEATSSIAPNAWRRNLGLMLDGLRAESAHPLTVAPLTPDQTLRVMLKLGSNVN